MSLLSHCGLGNVDYDLKKDEVSTGTTIIAASYDGGVVIGADSRTTTGAYIANRVTDKLTKVCDNIYCCRSGSAADTQAITDIVAYYMDLTSIQMGEPPLVKAAASVFRNLIYENRHQLTAGVIVAGWDKRFGGQVYSITVSGTIVQQNISIGGSGSSYLYGFMDSQYKDGMTQEECENLVLNAITLAIKRDGSSGGVVRMGVINHTGSIQRKLFLGDKLPKFYDNVLVQKPDISGGDNAMA
ncbi:Proteasome, subunit alpha/beta,Peptidase T1A, proteasome beta-subunit,Proteasome B-type [Cinara cedri]|uniref:proteasome endopeptidase complex n=1 Tax=Cinara cedri TaxID=506608 RepID=A0A5E4MMJ6_9HEMI|nr:Proteasome, subunit alpha/beta,Peptidase T1A, proteasome beta-subunit,Proteasome B-type [Cinara cedri]